MARKYKAVKVTKTGMLSDEKGNPVICPVRNKDCNYRCAWFSAEGRVIRCQDTIIGAIRGEPMRSFRLSTGPRVYEMSEPLGFKPAGNGYAGG